MPAIMRSACSALVLFGLGFVTGWSLGCGRDRGRNGDGGPADRALESAVDVMGTDQSDGTSDGGMNSLPVLQHGERYDDESRQHLIDPATARLADYSCRGSVTAPARGPSVGFSIEVRDFQSGSPVPDVCLRLYADNSVPNESSCISSGGVVTGASGLASVNGPANGWFSVRVFPVAGVTPSSTVVQSIIHNQAAPSAAGGLATVTAVSQATLDLIPTIYGFPRQAGTTVIVGRVFACSEPSEGVYGASIRVARDDGSYIDEGTSRTDPHYRYFDGSQFPEPSRRYTHVDGLYIVTQIPPGTGSVFVEAWGRSTTTSMPVIIGCERARVFSDSVTEIEIGPLRRDGPPCPGLAL